jgi:hypothetical protein
MHFSFSFLQPILEISGIILGITVIVIAGTIWPAVFKFASINMVSAGSAIAISQAQFASTQVATIQFRHFYLAEKRVFLAIGERELQKKNYKKRSIKDRFHKNS